MFENLTEKLSKTLRNLRGVGKLSEDNISDALAEVRKALLSADVHFRVVREFIDEVKDACLGQEVLKSVSPGQQVVKIINDELVKLLGEGSAELRKEKPLRILMVGLHGAGKTTTSAKLAKRLQKTGRLQCWWLVIFIVLLPLINWSFCQTGRLFILLRPVFAGCPSNCKSSVGRIKEKWF